MTPRARLLLIALTGLFKMALTRASCAGFAIASPKGAAFGSLRCAVAALLAATLVSGCAVREVPAVPPAPVIVGTAECPAPDAPVLPRLEAALPFDAPKNAALLLERDDAARHYINGLRAALRCYELQIEEQ